MFSTDYQDELSSAVQGNRKASMGCMTIFDSFFIQSRLFRFFWKWVGYTPCIHVALDKIIYKEHDYDTHCFSIPSGFRCFLNESVVSQWAYRTLWWRAFRTGWSHKLRWHFLGFPDPLVRWNWVHFWKPSHKGPPVTHGDPLLIHGKSIVDPRWAHVGPRWTHHGSMMDSCESTWTSVSPLWIHGESTVDPPGPVDLTIIGSQS